MFFDIKMTDLQACDGNLKSEIQWSESTKFIAKFPEIPEVDFK